MKSASSDVKDDYELRAELRALASVKHASFADEREVRLVIQRAGDLSPNPAVRISPSHGLVAYHEVAFPHDAIISITTAPGGNQARARHALRSLLSDGGRGAWSHVEIRSTDIPFNW